MRGKKKRTRAASPSTAPEHEPISRPGEKAIEAFQEANNLDAIPRLSHGDEVVYAAEAERLRQEGHALLHPDRPVVAGAGEMVIRDDKAGEVFKGGHVAILETLEHPDSISVRASSQRMFAAQAADVLEPAVDAAMSVQAANSVEKMLVHQMTAAHFHAMKLLRMSTETGLRPLQPGEVARFTNAAGRMMEVYQKACLTLLKLKNGGAQRVEVQYQQVNVGPGGQALVAGRVGGGSRRRGGGKNGR